MLSGKARPTDSRPAQGMLTGRKWGQGQGKEVTSGSGHLHGSGGRGSRHGCGQPSFKTKQKSRRKHITECAGRKPSAPAVSRWFPAGKLLSLLPKAILYEDPCAGPSLAPLELLLGTHPGLHRAAPVHHPGDHPSAFQDEETEAQAGRGPC